MEINLSLFNVKNSIMKYDKEYWESIQRFQEKNIIATACGNSNADDPDSYAVDDFFEAFLDDYYEGNNRKRRNANMDRNICSNLFMGIQCVLSGG